jgi:hypothetical protein
MASTERMDAILAELDWIADRGFAGAYVPGYFHRSDTPPPYDRFWDRFWARLTELGLPAVIARRTRYLLDLALTSQAARVDEEMSRLAARVFWHRWKTQTCFLFSDV